VWSLDNEIENVTFPPGIEELIMIKRAFSLANRITDRFVCSPFLALCSILGFRSRGGHLGKAQLQKLYEAIKIHRIEHERLCLAEAQTDNHAQEFQEVQRWLALELAFPDNTTST